MSLLSKLYLLIFEKGSFKLDFQKMFSIQVTEGRPFHNILQKVGVSPLPSVVGTTMVKLVALRKQAFTNILNILPTKM